MRDLSARETISIMSPHMITVNIGPSSEIKADTISKIELIKKKIIIPRV
jgi:hypothetical protein